MRHISRRDFLATLSTLGVVSSAIALDDRPAYRDRGPGFFHGVASGDPLHDRVILWTKITPRHIDDIVTGIWRVCLDARMERPWLKGAFATDISSDFTVKIDAVGLEPGQVYFYSFEITGAQSQIGRTKTLPIGKVSSMRFAFASCANYSYGYFNAYNCIAARDDIDFVVHLGDYIYEKGLGNYADPRLAGLRDADPVHEILTLTDYRQRHALYKSDVDLQAVHRMHPFICVWDDHESADDSYADGAANHDPDRGEGDWQTRKLAAIRAYNEHMPIRNRSPYDNKIYRSFKLGNLADLIMLDTRLSGRDKQAMSVDGKSDIRIDNAVLSDANRTLLGFEQERWLESQLWNSKLRGSSWRVLGQQVMMAQLSSTFGATIDNPDQWDGYGPARTRLFRHLLDNDIGNNIVLSGDAHSSWANELHINPWQSMDRAVGVEFVAPAITSPGWTEDEADAISQARQVTSVSPQIKYLDVRHRGYGVVTVTHNSARNDFYHLATVANRSTAEILAASHVCERGSTQLHAA